MLSPCEAKGRLVCCPVHYLLLEQKSERLTVHYKRLGFPKLEIPLLLHNLMCAGFTQASLCCPVGNYAQETGANAHIVAAVFL